MSNTALVMLDNQVLALKNRVDNGEMVRFAHRGFSSFVRATIVMIKDDVHLHEENEEDYKEFTKTEEIVEKLEAIFNDAKNLLLLKKLTPEIIDFFNSYIILVNNWNKMELDSKEISTHIDATIRLLDIFNSFETILERVGASLSALEHHTSVLSSRSNLTLATSSTYLGQIHKDIEENEQ